MAKFPDRRLYDAMLKAKRIETLVSWGHTSSDAFMGEFKAESGHTFGLETGKEITAAFNVGRRSCREHLRPQLPR